MRLPCLLFLMYVQLAVSAPSAKSNSTDCQSCHSEQFRSWKQSDHAHSMSVANKQTVLANFNNSTAKHFSQSGHFYTEDESFYVRISDAGQETTYKVEYTFGYFPLQQYLVQVGNGRYQVLPFAWDTRSKENGGQRWYQWHTEDIPPNDRLHWLQPLQNWNGMCADCHSDGLVRHFDVSQNQFQTEFEQVNVGCLSCHDGKQKKHDDIVKTAKKGEWKRAENQRIATWHGPPRDNRYAQTCYACHALRTPLTDGFNSQDAFLDQFTPSWIAPPMYYEDGQIKEEVFVYGSFLQSKMAQMGVTCIDCHDPHSGKLIKPQNEVCLQCHAPDAYDTKLHHGHQMQSDGAMCINCHMPKSTFMGVDARGDHSFRIPRPELSISHNQPNACTTCHDDKTAEWALQQLSALHPDRKGPSGLEIAKLEVYSSMSLDSIKRVADAPAQPAIVRANAIAQLIWFDNLSSEMLKPYIESDKPLIRLAAAQAGERLSQRDKATMLPALLTDKYKSIRVAAVHSLVDVLPAKTWQEAFEKAFTEMQTGFENTSWRGEGLVNGGNAARRSKHFSEAVFRYEASMLIDPYFAPAYLNLADLYRFEGDTGKEAETLKSGILNIPSDPQLHYAYALHFVRSKRLDSALIYAQKASELSKTDPGYAYLYLLTLDALGKREIARKEIDALIERVSDNRQLKALKAKWRRQVN